MKKYMIGIYEKAIPEKYTIPQMLIIAQNAGYDFFEISIDKTRERIDRLYDQKYIDLLQDSMNQTKLPIHSICLSALGTYTLGNQNPRIAQQGLNIFYQAVLFAAQLGIRIIQVPACDMPKFELGTISTDRLFLNNLKKAVEFASVYGILIALENMENDYMNTIEKCMRAIKTINSPYFQLYPDSGNITSAAFKYGASPLNDMYLGKGHYVAFHLKETCNGKFGGLFYGEGHVNFPGLIQTAWKLGVRRFVMEYWYTGNPNWEDDLVKARNICSDCLDN